MRRRIALVLLALALALIPGVVFAQGSDTLGDILIRFNGPLNVAAGQTTGSAVVINHNAVVAGTVEDVLFVYGGTATISGAVNGDVMVVNGTVDLLDGARVHNVSLANSTLNQAAGATIAGTVSRSAGVENARAFTAASAIVWFTISLAIVLAALAFAAFGGRQLSTASDLFTSQPGETALSAVLIGIGLPVVAVLAMVTVVGIPFGIGLLLFLLPALAFLGYVVTGTVIGTAVVRAFGGRPAPNHPYLAAVVGVVILELIGLVPVLGGFVGFVATLAGAGALILLAWRGWRGPRQPATTTLASGTPSPA